MNRDAPTSEFTEEIGLGQTGRFGRLTERGFLDYKQADGQVQRRALW
jgi:hypothetical protein